MQAPPVIAPARSRSWWWLALALPVLAGGIVLYLFNPSQYGFYPRCTLYTITGLYCPGCGSQRALYELAHGHVLTALHDNLVLMLALPVVGVSSLRCARAWLKGEPLPSLGIRPSMVKILVGLVIVFTILRNIHIAPFNWLAPL